MSREEIAKTYLNSAGKIDPRKSEARRIQLKMERNSKKIQRQNIFCKQSMEAIRELNFWDSFMSRALPSV